MHRLWITVLLVVITVTTAHAQRALTFEQRLADLNQLASFYEKTTHPTNGNATCSVLIC
jgi:hypothetical protein